MLVFNSASRDARGGLHQALPYAFVALVASAQVLSKLDKRYAA